MNDVVLVKSSSQMIAAEQGDAPLGAAHSAARVPRLSVVVPVHNEAGNIAALAAEIEAALGAEVDFEMLFVDDGSDDESPAELARARRGHSRLQVLRHRERCGQSAALRTGIAAARADWIASLDGDGQNDPADIVELLKVRDESDDPALRMIAGVRRRRRDGAVKHLASRVANGLRSRILRDGAADTGCGLKLFRRETFLALPFFDHMHRFLPALIRRAGGVIVEVPVGHRPRRCGASHYGVVDRAWAGVVDMLGVVWLQRRAKLPVVEWMNE